MSRSQGFAGCQGDGGVVGLSARIGIGAGIIFVLVVTTAAVVSVAGAQWRQQASPVDLSASAACGDDAAAGHTVTWTLRNHDAHAATVIDLSGSAEAELSDPVPTEIPAARDGRPGVVTFDQYVPDSDATQLAVRVAWEQGGREFSTPTIDVPGRVCLRTVEAGELSVTQPSCDADDPGGDGTLLVSGADSGVGYAVQSTDGAAAIELVPDVPFTVLVDDEPVTVIVAPRAPEGSVLSGYDPGDWTVTFAPVVDGCA